MNHPNGCGVPVTAAGTVIRRNLTLESSMAGSSSQAVHRMVGSVAVSLAGHAPVPLVIVP